MWLWATFASSLLLGVYEVYKKLSLKENAVVPVLFLTTVFCSLFFLPLLLLSEWAPQSLENTLFFVPRADAKTHLFILLKSFIVLSSWAAAYYASKIYLNMYLPLIHSAVFVLMVLYGFWGALNLWQGWGAGFQSSVFSVLLCGQKRRYFF